MKWEQSVKVETAEYICFVKRIDGVVTEKTLESELIRCENCAYYKGDHQYCENDYWAVDRGHCNWAERKKEE